MGADFITLAGNKHTASHMGTRTASKLKLR
ncbi:MAG: hypothetical protein DID89_2727548065 [Candidatus Nitrotoga sp. CP45]|nr:MAG: hypothetical protein DID89_2727548065 [Candidatus Nitrotoga sp. CP45]